MRTIKDIDFDNKRVLIRVGFNVPLDDDGNVVSDIRIKESIPTIKYILEHNAKQIILMSHLGRPDAKIIMLENLRFHKEEEKNDEHFAERLSKLADIYVNDAFADMHRAHASTVGITKFMPGCIGFLVEKELKYLTLKEIERPFVAILGGAKISTKILVIKELLKKVDYLLLGGAMIFTFYKAKGYEIGKSMFEEDFITEAKMLLNNEKVILPDDIVVAADKTEDSETHVVNEHQIPKDMIGLDIGPESIQVFKDYLKKAKTVFWNGPLGYFELEKFGKSTRAIAEYLADSDKVVIIGGGDTEDAILPWKDQYTHVSTGGGASLEFISGKELPAIQALKENEIEFHDVI